MNTLWRASFADSLAPVVQKIFRNGISATFLLVVLVCYRPDRTLVKTKDGPPIKAKMAQKRPLCLIKRFFLKGLHNLQTLNSEAIARPFKRLPDPQSVKLKMV
jgi:hypothetical protein